MNAINNHYFERDYFARINDIIWVFSCAFLESYCENNLCDPNFVFYLIKLFDLEPRIGGRCSREILEETLGKKYSDILKNEYALNVKRNIIINECCKKILNISKKINAQIIFLKGSALLILNKIPLGQRKIGDIDILVPFECALKLQEEIKRHGFKEFSISPNQKHLPALISKWGVIEIHTGIDEINLEPKKALCFNDAIKNNLVISMGDEGIFVPKEELLASHLIVHGLSKHLNSLSYPFFRLVGDFKDLGWRYKNFENYKKTYFNWIKDSLDEEYFDSFSYIFKYLEGEKKTDLYDLFLRNKLLNHVLLCYFDSRYKKIAYVKDIFRRIKKESFKKTAKFILNSVLINNNQINIIYGKPKDKKKYIFYKLIRPFHVGVKIMNYLFCFLKMKYAKYFNLIYKDIMKRLIDIVLSSIFLLLLLPIIFILSILIIVCMGRPIFFVQERVGKNFKIFNLIKIRTMNNLKDESGALLPDIKRITKLGKFLRKYSLDEIVSLINVLKGEMSLVGPRPLPKKYLPYFFEREKIRFSVRPGLTGLAQIHGRNRLNWDQRFRYDVEYVENLSLWLDLKILAKTVLIVLISKGFMYNPNELFDDLDVYRKNLKNKNNDDNI